MADSATAEQIRLIELDLGQTNELIKGVTTIGAGIRTAAITTWLGLLGFAFQQRLDMLALLAVIVASVFYLADAYHGWIYASALQHAYRVERLLAQYYASLVRRADDPSIEYRLEGALRAHKFGCYSSLGKFGLKAILAARPTIIFDVMYPILIGLAAIFYLLLLNQWLGPPLATK